MTTADLVNLILEKLRTGRVKFLRIWEDGINAPFFIEFEYGSNTYKLTYFKLESQKIQVSRVLGENYTSTDSYSQWVEGVLNSKTRDDDGNLS